MVVNYFTYLDGIAIVIDDLFTLEDLCVSATGDSDKPTVEPVAFELVPKSVAATKTHWREGNAVTVPKPEKEAPPQQMTVVVVPEHPHTGRGSGAGQSPPATVPIEAVVALP
jgi:hypothetical protein